MSTYRFLIFFSLSSYILFTSAKCKTSEPTPPSSTNAIEICTSSDVAENNNFFNENTTLRNHNPNGVDYIIGCGITITENIIIEAGVTIWMERDAYILTGENGQIQANGTASAPILIEGKDQKEIWQGLEFRKGNNVLEYVTIKNAGAGSNESTVYVSSFDADLTVNNCTFADGTGYGLYIGWAKSELSFSNNTITRHKKAPVYLTANHVHLLDKASKFSGNEEDFIQVAVEQVVSNAKWLNLGLPYQIVKVVPQTDWISPAENKTLTIEEGVTLQFGTESGMESGKGRLAIVGTSSQPIKFEGVNTGKGTWYGIYIGGSLSSDIKHTVVDGGGAYTGGSSYPASANVMVESNATLNISNSSLNNSKTCGLGDQSGAIINSNDLSFEGNTGGNQCTR